MSYFKTPTAKLRLLAGCAPAGLLLAAALGGAAVAQDTETGTASQTSDVITITGYRGSLAQSLNIKREETGSVDAIVADDIADFPDLNLAESLQRIPGVAITRDSGEGRAITVRGLSGEFTRVRVNGMEAIAGTTGEGSVNRGRSFDFNVFASELFNNIIVRKTASADVDEGSLGAVVDLNTARPFDYDEGTTFVINAQAQYNDLIEEAGPRLAGLFAYNDPAGQWGVTFSAAYSDNATSELGHNTVRWQRARFASVGGVDCLANPTDAGCAEVTGAFHPRIPRYGEIALERERLGLTGGFQWRPTDRTEITIDGLYSEYNASRQEYWLEVLFRGNEGGMDVTDYTYDAATNNLTATTVDNAWVRSENYRREWSTQFHQVGINIDHDFTDTFRVNFFAGSAESDTTIPSEVTFMYDDRDYTNFRYDYTDDENPVIAFDGPSVTDPGNFQLTELRDRPSGATHGFENVSFSAEWDLSPRHSIEGGVSYKKFTFDTYGFRRDAGVCGAGLFPCDTANGIFGPAGTDALSDSYTFDDDQGAGSTSSWVVPSLTGWADYFDLYNLPAAVDQGSTRSVEEVDMAAFIQLNGSAPIGTMDLDFNIGVRYVETDQSSTGYNSGTQVTVDREPYEDWLPSANVALWINDDLVVRGAAARVMTRPSLGNLTPGGSVDSFNYRVSFQNPYLDPTRADAFDASVEWYFADESLLSFAVFYKDIESRPMSETRTGTYASTGLPLNLLVPTSPTAQNPEGGPLESCNPANGGSGCWEIRQIGNGPGGSLQGFEVGFQMPFEAMFDNLPPIVEDMGFTGNYTWVDSEVDYYGGTITERLFGLSNTSYNATLYYAGERLEARISAAQRDDYITGTRDGDFEGYNGTFNVDFSSSYEVNENFQISFEALNLTDDYQDRFTDRNIQRRYEYDHTGRVFIFGVRYTH